MADLQNTVTSLNNAFGALGDPADMAGNIRRLQNGISQLASGAQALATGVHTLADSNIEMLSGMGQIATQLQNSARSSAGSTTPAAFTFPLTPSRIASSPMWRSTFCLLTARPRASPSNPTTTPTAAKR